VFTNKKREGINIFVCAISIYVVETPKASINEHELPLPIISFSIVAYGFVGQPFSKQLYFTRVQPCGVLFMPSHLWTTLLKIAVCTLLLHRLLYVIKYCKKVKSYQVRRASVMLRIEQEMCVDKGTTDAAAQTQIIRIHSNTFKTKTYTTFNFTIHPYYSLRII